MPINYKDINELTEETNIVGTEKVPVSGTKYVLFNKIKDWIINSLKTTGLDLGGNKIKNAGFEVVASLPTTNNFVGRQVTYQGRSYIWNGSEWKCDSDYLEIGGRNYIKWFKNTDWKIHQNATVLSNKELVHIGTTGAGGINRSTLRVILEKGEYICHGFTKGDAQSIIVFRGGQQNKIYYFNPSEEYLPFVKYFTITQDAEEYTIEIGGVSGTTEGLYFKELKLEKGNKATDWTPAPEDKADENQTINFNTNNTEPTQSGTATKTSTWLWQYLTQSVNFLWLKLKDLFPTTQATTHNYLPKIDNANKKLVKSNISDNGTAPKYGNNTIWHSGNLGYDKLGDMPVATESKVGGIKLGFNPELDADLLDGYHASDFAPASARANRTIKVEGNDKLGSATINPLNFKSGDDAINIEGQVNSGILDIVFSSVHAGIPTSSTNFNSIRGIGSYKVSGGYYYAPSRNCGTNTSLTASMRGTLNVFRSGGNTSEITQQLFWVLDGVTEQYQRSYSGADPTWTIWKRLIKCDDYADPTTGKGGIISAANISELFRAPDLIQLWNESDLDLSNGVFHLNDLLPIVVSIENILHLDGNNISGLDSERRYRVTYDVLCARKGGEGEVTIRIKDGNGDELCYITEYLFNYEFWKSTTFSIIITNTDIITPSIEVSSKLGIILHGSSYRVIVEEIKFPFFYPNN